VDTQSTLLREKLFNEWIQFYGEFLVIIALLTEYPHIEDDIYRRALADAEAKQKEPLPEDTWDRIGVKLSLLKPKLVEDFPVLLRRTTLVMVVASFEAFLMSSIDHVLRAHNELIKAKLDGKQRKKITDPAKMIKKRINKEIDGLVSIKNKLDYITGHLKVDPEFPRPMDVEGEIFEIDATRNLIVHSRCIVTQRYLNAARGSKLKIGEERPIPHEYVRQSCNTLFNASRYLHFGFEKTFCLINAQKND
jgi:hypothetical protein